jgi:branched-subunit amino acid aminotransferase/4-amino-4-deoxychorismate lyase
MKETVFLNGKLLALKEAHAPLSAPGFLSGYGLFETMRASRDKIIYLDAHLKRLQDSCRLIHLACPYSQRKLKAIIAKTLKINGFQDAYLRITLWKDVSCVGILVLIKEYRPYPIKKYKKGFSASIAEFRQNEYALLSRIKSTSRILYELNYDAAKDMGFDESLILNGRGYLCEGTRANLFFAKGGLLFTPALACGCLDGITRRVVFALAKREDIRIFEGNFTLQDLCVADEAFLTNSLIGVMPLTSVVKQKINQGLRGKLTTKLIKEYGLLLKNED